MESPKTSNKESEIFSKILKQLINHHSISFNKLGALTGVDRSHLKGLTTGKYSNPKLNTIAKVAGFFKVRLAQLLGEQKIDFENRPKNLELDCDSEE
jgi:transcriptional regulator with XRE-family HTH domain